MFFKHKQNNKKNKKRLAKKANVKNKENSNRPRRRPAIVMHDSARKQSSRPRKSNQSSKAKDKKKVSLFKQKDPKVKEENRRTDELVASLKAKRFNHKVIDLLGYKGLTDDKNHFIKLSNSVIDGSNVDVHKAKYADILRIGGTGIDSLPESMVQHLLSDYVNFWRSYLDDVTCICLPLPNDSKDQQHEWQNQIDRENEYLLRGNPSPRIRQQMIARKNLMQENLDTLQNVDQYLINQGFALLVFGQNKRELSDNVASVTRLSQYSLHLSRLNADEKENLLKRINNPAMMINMADDDE